VQTPFGWRFPTGGYEGVRRDLSLELHRDQTLAALAELGLPLSHPLHGMSGSGTVRDVLADSLANFHLDQEELAWTALAYSLYLRPTRSWTNRYDEAFCFDDLASTVLDRPLDAESCGGTHLLYSLTVLARVDQQTPVLSAAVRERLWKYLQRAVDAAVGTQQPDGSWHSGWNYTSLPKGAPQGWSYKDGGTERIAATGHIAEWMLYLPEALQVRPHTLKQAGCWLKKELSETPLELKEERYCPDSHAACVLRQIAFVSEEEGTWANLAADRWSGYVLAPKRSVLGSGSLLGAGSVVFWLFAGLVWWGRRRRQGRDVHRVAAVMSALVTIFLAAAPGFAATETTPTPDEKIWRTVERDGLNCLYLLLRQDGHAVRYEELRSTLNPDSRQVSLLTLTEVARDFGMPLAVKRCSPSDLATLSSPMIAHVYNVRTSAGGFMLVFHAPQDADGKFGVIEPGTARIINLTVDEFRRAWSGLVLVPDGRGAGWQLAWAANLFLLAGYFWWRSQNTRRKGRIQIGE